MKKFILLLDLFITACVSKPVYAVPYYGNFKYDVYYTNDGTANGNKYYTALMAGRDYLNNLIIGYASPNGAKINTFKLAASLENIDGGGGILGSGGTWSTIGTYPDYVYGMTERMRYDSADINRYNQEGFNKVVFHEMLHALGVGPLWTINKLYTYGSGQYVGKYGLAAYQKDYNKPNATYIPVELDYGAGSANSHWDEAVFGKELMTPKFNPDATLSRMTIQSLKDLGYVLREEATPVPLPATGLLLLGSLVFFRRKLV